MKQELLDLANHVISHAEKLGATQAEAYLESSRILEVKLDKGVIRLATEKLDLGCGIRTVIGTQVGISYVTSLLETDLNQAVQDSLKAARASIPDSDFSSLAINDSSYPSVSGLFDKQTAHLDCEEAVEIVKRSVQSSREVSGEERNMIEGDFSARLVTRVIVNSFGISGLSTETQARLELYSAIGSGENQCSSGEYQNFRSIRDINPENVGATSARNALSLRGAKSFNGGEMPLILTPRALNAVLGFGVAKALDARQVQDGKSYLIDSLGSEIASPELEIADNGLLSGAIGSRPFDAEGIPSQITPLISSGILRNYLHDSYSSSKDGVESTGNASRSSYRVTPKIASSNLIVTPGTVTLDDMISEVKEGVLCTDTFDRPNMVTGELSAMIMEGFLVHKGEIKHPLKSTLFGITMKDLLKRIVLVGSDVESRGSLLSPSLMIESAKITSG